METPDAMLGFRKGVLIMAKKAEKNINEKITALYCRLSVDDIRDKDKDKDKDSESNSIINQNPLTTAYAWAEPSIEHILRNMQYTGCTVNFKTTTVSYKVHKTVHNDAEDWVIIPNT